MNRIYVFLLGAIVFASCSSPKYTYHFDHYDYNSGRPKTAETAIAPTPAAPAQAVQTEVVESPVLTASASEETQVLATETKASSVDKKASTLSYKEMNKEERKAFRKEVKKEFKDYVKAVKKGEQVSAQGGNLDPDLKMAILFGAVGLVLALFGGVSEVFTILGVIAILVGVYFLIKWLIRQ